MHEAPVEALFARFRDHADADALAAVFDRLAPKLLLVAAHLAGGNVAEDLVQATFLDAMRQRRRWDAARPLAPWLLGLLANHVREARRQRRRVPDPLRLAVREAASPVADVEADECFAAVAAAVDALPRHYRQVLSLRLVHGLELQQIAHSLDVPLGTVKVRVHRGLALLRRALPAGLTASFAVLLTPSLGLAMVRQRVLAEASLVAGAGTAAGVGAGIVLGGWLMKKLVIGAAVIALAIGGWFAFDPFASGVAPAVAPTVTPAKGEVAAAALAPETNAANSAGARDAGPQREPASTRAPGATTGTVRVTAVWSSDGAPAGDFEVSLNARPGPEPLSSRTDAAGAATFAEVAPGAYRVSVIVDPGTEPVPVEVRAGETATARIVVRGDIRLHVLVVDAADVPRAGATVWCSDTYTMGEKLRALGTTDAAGVLAWRGRHVDQVWARAAGNQPSAPFRLPELRGPDVPLEPVSAKLVLGATGCTVRGTVAAPDGSAAGGARVAIACDDTLQVPRPELVVTTDGQGRFQCDEVPAGPRCIAALLPELAPALQRITTSPTEPTIVALQLLVGATLSGRIAKADGTPMPNVMLTTQPKRVMIGLQMSWGTSARTFSDAEGRYRVPAIPPGEFTARVGVEPMLQRDFDAIDGAQLTWDPVRTATRTIRGVVVDANDKPLRDWQVTGSEGGERGLFARRTITDAAGQFELKSLPDAPQRVFVFAPGAAGSQLGAAFLVARVIVENVSPSDTPITIRVDANAAAMGWIEGSLTMPADAPAKAVLQLYPHAMRRHGGFVVPTERLQPGATTFRLGPLPAGEYDLYCDTEGRGRIARRGLRLAANETLRLPPFAFDAQRPRQIVLRRANGSPAARGVVRLKSNNGACRETAPGVYESLPVADEDDEVLVRGPDFAAAAFPIHASNGRPIELAVADATRVEVHLIPRTPRERWVGGFRVTITDAVGTKVVSEIVQIDGGADFRWPVGLVPGTYSFAFEAVEDGKANTTATVGTSPLQIDVQFAK